MSKLNVMAMVMLATACGDDRPADPDGAIEADADVQVEAHEACRRHRGAVLDATRRCLGGNGPELAETGARWDALCGAATGTLSATRVELCVGTTGTLGVVWTDRACQGTTVVWGPRAVTCLEAFGGP